MRSIQLYTREEKQADDTIVNSPKEAIEILAAAFNRDAATITEQTEQILVIDNEGLSCNIQVELENSKYLVCYINTNISSPSYRKLPPEKRAMIANAANLDIGKHVFCYALPDRTLIVSDFLFTTKKMLLHLAEKRFNRIIKDIGHIATCYQAICDSYAFEQSRNRWTSE